MYTDVSNVIKREYAHIWLEAEIVFVGCGVDSQILVLSISKECSRNRRTLLTLNQHFASNFCWRHLCFDIFAGHDCSVRLWNLETKTCVQEITAHRKKFDESIFDVAFHPSKPYIASAGADALAKVFVWNNTYEFLRKTFLLWKKKLFVSIYFF